MIESGLAGTVRSGEGHNDGPLVEPGEFLQRAALNRRRTNRPTVRLPLGIHANQHPRTAGGRFVVWKRLGIDMLGDEAPALGRIDHLDAGRERLDLPCATQRQNLGS